jgi:phosphoglycerol transferase MdoB-like AlkP superfamily enzyme
MGSAGSWIMPSDKAEGVTAVLLAKSTPLVKWMTNPIMGKKKLMDTARQLGMEQMLQRPAGSTTRPSRRLNVVLIFQESSYNKYLSLFNGKVETQPLLSLYKDRMELFPNFFSNFAASINSRFATFSGLYPVRDYKKFTLDRVNVKSLFDILSGNDYQCSLFYSSYLDYTGFRDFLAGRGLEAMYDAENMPGKYQEASVAWGLNEDETTRAIRTQIKEYANHHDTFFLTYIPAAPHNPFDGVPDRFQKYKLKQMGDYTPLYLNDLLYMDSCIVSILDQLKASGVLDNTLVIITDDHGEMLGENGGPIGHGWSARPELTNIPLIIMDPDNPGYRVNNTRGSQVDLLPTILDLLGMRLPEDQLYQGISLYSPAAQGKRMIYINSLQQYGIVDGDRYFCGTRETQAGVAVDDFAFKTYSITNSDARTRFTLLPASDVSTPSIDQFDDFQESFLKNYSEYCQLIRN